jgi:hypothetical protein
VKDVVGSGGSLADDEYDEFVFRGVVAGEVTPGTKVYFPVIQECTDGTAERLTFPLRAKPRTIMRHPHLSLRWSRRLALEDRNREIAMTDRSPAGPHCFYAAILFWVAALISLFVIIGPSRAFAHASLVASSPVQGEILPARPLSIVLTFNEAVALLAITVSRTTSIIMKDGLRWRIADGLYRKHEHSAWPFSRSLSTATPRTIFPPSSAGLALP